MFYSPMGAVLGEDGNGNTKLSETLTEIAFRPKLSQHSANARTNSYIDICSLIQWAVSNLFHGAPTNHSPVACSLGISVVDRTSLSCYLFYYRALAADRHH